MKCYRNESEVQVDLGLLLNQFLEFVNIVLKLKRKNIFREAMSNQDYLST